MGKEKLSGLPNLSRVRGGRGKIATWRIVVIGAVRKLRDNVSLKLGLRNQTDKFGQCLLTVS